MLRNRMKHACLCDSSIPTISCDSVRRRLRRRLRPLTRRQILFPREEPTLVQDAAKTGMQNELRAMQSIAKHASQLVIVLSPGSCCCSRCQSTTPSAHVGLSKDKNPRCQTRLKQASTVETLGCTRRVLSVVSNRSTNKHSY